MCGKALEEDEATSQNEAAEPDSDTGTLAVPARKQEDAPTPAPAYTGGMFNLGAPAERSSRNLDYLLVDDEPRSRKGLVLGILALVLVAGLGWLRWKTGGFGWLSAKSNKPAATQPASTDGDAAGADSSSGADGSNSSSTGSSAAAPPASGSAVTQPSAPASTPNNAANGGASATTDDKGAAPTDTKANTAGPAAGDATSGPASSSPAPAGQAAQPDQSTGTASSAPAAPQTAPAGTQLTADAAPPAAAAPPKPKPTPKPSAKPEDSVTLGEKYLYGRGVPQDCTKGLRYVKPAADKSNAKAMITMGALYATGHCLSRDLPTAYRFFALALRQDPENGPLKQNVEMVWGQMTQLERQQAMRLTQ